MEPEAATHGDLVGKHRLEALADGIYAIAVTLLVLELKIPALGDDATNRQLVAALIEVVPKALTWLLSFWVMAMFWLAQLRIFRLSAVLDWTMVRLELIQLALISLIPFSTALIGEHGDLAAAAAVYSANLFALAVLSWLRMSHLLAHPQLQAAPIDAPIATALRRRSGILVGATFVTLVLAFFVPGWNMLAMLPTALARRVARL